MSWSSDAMENVFDVVVVADSPPEVDKTDQWLGVAVASQATDRGLALVRRLDRVGYYEVTRRVTLNAGRRLRLGRTW